MNMRVVSARTVEGSWGEGETHHPISEESSFDLGTKRAWTHTAGRCVVKICDAGTILRCHRVQQESGSCSWECWQGDDFWIWDEPLVPTPRGTRGSYGGSRDGHTSKDAYYL